MAPLKARSAAVRSDAFVTVHTAPEKKREGKEKPLEKKLSAPCKEKRHAKAKSGWPTSL
jgi:hypothetical protein